MLSKEDYLLLKENEEIMESNDQYFFLFSDYFIMKSKDTTVSLEKREMAFEEALCLSHSIDMRENFKSQISREEFLFFMEACKDKFPVLDMELQKHYFTEKEFIEWRDEYYETIMNALSKGKTENISETEKIHKNALMLYGSYFHKVLSMMYLTNEQFENILFKVLEITQKLPERYQFLCSDFWSSLSSTFNEIKECFISNESFDLLLMHRERVLNIITSEKFFKEFKKTSLYRKEAYDDAAIDRYILFLEHTKEIKRLKPLTVMILNGLFEEWSEIFKDNPNSQFLKRFGEVFLKFARKGAGEHFREALFLGALNDRYVSLPNDKSSMMAFNSVISTSDLKELSIIIRSEKDGYCKMNCVPDDSSFSLNPIDHFKLNTVERFKKVGLIEIYKFIEENNKLMISKDTGRITDEGWDLIDLNFAY